MTIYLDLNRMIYILKEEYEYIKDRSISVYKYISLLEEIMESIVKSNSKEYG